MPTNVFLSDQKVLNSHIFYSTIATSGCSLGNSQFAACLLHGRSGRGLGLLLEQLNLEKIAEHHVGVFDPGHQQMVEPFLRHCSQSFLLLLLSHVFCCFKLFLLQEVRVLEAGANV